MPVYVVDLARVAGYSDLAQQIEQQGIGAAAARLAQMERGLFPWRAEITNGYQHGFLLYALKGGVSESGGDTPRAYRFYENSLGCVDMAAATNALPEPYAEICVALGRCCRELGREDTADAWLHTALHVCPANDQIYEAATVELAELAAAQGDYKKSADLLTRLFDRVLMPGKPAFALLADSFFYCGDDVDAFDVLIAGLNCHTADAVLLWNDPLIQLYKKRLGRATETDIYILFEALGGQIDRVAPIAGNEELMAYLVNERTLLTKAFPFLTQEDDLARVRALVARQQAGENTNRPPWRAAVSNAGAIATNSDEESE
jgi:tetratricopeptide (TPR) repeat protein